MRGPAIRRPPPSALGKSNTCFCPFYKCTCQVQEDHRTGQPLDSLSHDSGHCLKFVKTQSEKATRVVFGVVHHSHGRVCLSPKSLNHAKATHTCTHTCAHTHVHTHMHSYADTDSEFLSYPLLPQGPALHVDFLKTTQLLRSQASRATGFSEPRPMFPHLF